MSIIKSVKFLFSILQEDKFVCSENKHTDIKAVSAPGSSLLSEKPKSGLQHWLRK